MARCYFVLADKAGVKKYYSLVETSSPAMAERYTYLLDVGTGRASAADDSPPLIWLTED